MSSVIKKDEKVYSKTNSLEYIFYNPYEIITYSKK